MMFSLGKTWVFSLSEIFSVNWALCRLNSDTMKPKTLKRVQCQHERTQA